MTLGYYLCFFSFLSYFLDHQIFLLQCFLLHAMDGLARVQRHSESFLKLVGCENSVPLEEGDQVCVWHPCHWEVSFTVLVFRIGQVQCHMSLNLADCARGNQFSHRDSGIG